MDSWPKEQSYQSTTLSTFIRRSFHTLSRHRLSRLWRYSSECSRSGVKCFLKPCGTSLIIFDSGCRGSARILAERVWHRQAAVRLGTDEEVQGAYEDDARTVRLSASRMLAADRAWRNRLGALVYERTLRT